MNREARSEMNMSEMNMSEEKIKGWADVLSPAVREFLDRYSYVLIEPENFEAVLKDLRQSLNDDERFEIVIYQLIRQRLRG